MRIFPGRNVPIKSWCMEPEAGALQQAHNLSSLPFIFKHVALMPDTHQGYGMPIGGVIATDGVVIPNAVGVDIGCGMVAVKTPLKDLSQEQIKKIFGGSKEFKGGIRGNVPVGRNHQSKKQSESLLTPFTLNYEMPIVSQQYNSALKQLGTLGGGNHFIEIQKGSDGFIWIMIHSGSRNLGFTVAKHYNNVAQELCKKWHSDIPAFKGEDGLAFLPLDSKEGKAYLKAMNYCTEFALANRKLMMDRVIQVFINLGLFNDDFNGLQETRDSFINIAHNYARLENHFGRNVMVHRKGATSAQEGEIGIIPGSQGTKSYIVRGLGNPESFKSCSHGAGRKMSRTVAKKTLCLEDEVKAMDDQGIIHSIRGLGSLDEAPSAYKDIAVVMEEQKDLVEILVELTPLGVIKG